MSLIPGVAAPSLDARLTPTMHRLHKVLKDGLRDGVPFDLQYLGKPGQGSRRGAGLEKATYHFCCVLKSVHLLPRERQKVHTAVTWLCLLILVASDDGLIGDRMKHRIRVLSFKSLCMRMIQMIISTFCVKTFDVHLQLMKNGSIAMLTCVLCVRFDRILTVCLLCMVLFIRLSGRLYVHPSLINYNV